MSLRKIRHFVSVITLILGVLLWGTHEAFAIDLDPETMRMVTVARMKANACEGLFVGGPQDPIRVFSGTPLLEELELNEVRAALEHASKVLFSKFSLPPQLKVFVVAHEFASEAHTDVSEIVVPYSSLSLFQIPDAIFAGTFHFSGRPVAMHEYGHVIFEQNIARVFRPLEMVRQWKIQFALLFPALEIAVQRNDTQKIGLIQRDAAALQELFDLYKPLIDLEKSYSEFFADLVAVLDANDPQALGAFFKEISPLSEDGKERDFSIDHPDASGIEDDIYKLLAPTRSFVWKLYKSEKRFESQRAEFLKAVFDAIASEIRRRYDASDSGTIKNLETSQEINQRLIGAIARAVEVL